MTEPLPHTSTRRREPASMALAFFVSSVMHAGLWAAVLTSGGDGYGDVRGAGAGSGGGGDEPLFTITLRESSVVGIGEDATTVVPLVGDPTSELVSADSVTHVERATADAPQPATEAPVDAAQRADTDTAAVVSAADVATTGAPEIEIEIDELVDEHADAITTQSDAISVSGPTPAPKEGAAGAVLANGSGEQSSAHAVEHAPDDPAARTLASGGLARQRGATSGTRDGAVDAQQEGGAGAGTRGGALGSSEGGTGGDRGDGRNEAALVYSPDPVYPAQSISRREEGRVVCVLHVGGDGRVRRAEVTQSSGYPRLDRAAVEALGHWRFQASKGGGSAAPFTFTHTVRFVLK